MIYMIIKKIIKNKKNYKNKSNYFLYIHNFIILSGLLWEIKHSPYLGRNSFLIVKTIFLFPDKSLIIYPLFISINFIVLSEHPTNKYSLFHRQVPYSLILLILILFINSPAWKYQIFIFPSELESINWL